LSQTAFFESLQWFTKHNLLALQFVNSVAAAYPFKMTVDNDGKLKIGSQELTHCVIRIIKHCLKTLLKIKNVSVIPISRKQHEQFVIS
jgi:hypothetical protein